MRIENTDRFRNKYCGVHFKNGAYIAGKIIYIPNMSAKYNWHPVGWFLVKDGFSDQKLLFAEIADIEVMED